jgi:V/A-type H+/Na+-transporting ATPase subunit E
MQSKLQELTEKIYQEGLEKGNNEAKTIVEDARKQATEIVMSARKEAEQIIAVAQKSAEEKSKKTESELKLTSKQALNALKQQITDCINDKVIGKATGKAFDADFTKKIVESTLNNWSSAQSSELSILLPKAQEKELTEYFSKSVKDLLDKGLEIKFDAAISAGFQIAPKDGSYKVSFTEADFKNFFKQYLRPKLIDILFEE